MKKQPFSGKTAIVCGGSKGIGKETAKEIVQLGGSVSIVARDQDVLQEAAKEIEENKITTSQFVETISCDATEMDALKSHFEIFIKKHGVPDSLLNVVGYAYPQYIQELTLDDFRKNMDINYYGQLVPTLILLPYFIEREYGQIGFVSSINGYVGAMGYATYCPTKFAIVGLAETLRNELKPYNIDISIFYPSDTKTPGYEIEKITQPPEIAIMSEVITLYSPEEMAKLFISGMLKRKFTIIPIKDKWTWILMKSFPRIAFFVLDYLLNRARKKIGKV